MKGASLDGVDGFSYLRYLWLLQLGLGGGDDSEF